MKTKPEQMQVTPEQVQAAGGKLLESMERKISALQSAIQDERAAILAANLSREELVDLLAQTTVHLRYAQHDRQVDKDFAAANFNAGWSESDKRAVKRERQPRKDGASKTNSQYIEPKAWVIAEWQRTKHLHLVNGKPSKAAFVRHITEIPKNGNNIFRKATGILAHSQTIEKRWLKGID